MIDKFRDSDSVMISTYRGRVSAKSEMSPEMFPDLVAHLVRTSSLTEPDAQKVIGEIVSYFAEPIERFVKRRHGELQRAGFANAEIFDMVRDDLRLRRFVAPELSARQIRRIIYG
jgi:hypothetical protein